MRTYYGGNCQNTSGLWKLLTAQALKIVPDRCGDFKQGRNRTKVEPDAMTDPKYPLEVDAIAILQLSQASLLSQNYVS